MDKKPFAELGLSPAALQAVAKLGFELASPIQTAAIPVILAGRDLVGLSSTGSGKTAAFALPALEKLDPKLRAPQALVLCPTRELAVQVAEDVAQLGHFHRGLQVVPIYGGQSYERQFRALAAGTQFVIGTPGRILDHLERGTLQLDDLRIVVLDECDRMLDMGFRDDIEKVLKTIPDTAQRLFFSATMPPAIAQLTKGFTRDPVHIRIEAKAANAPKVEQSYVEVHRRDKIDVLSRLIDFHDFRYGIIFCATKVMVDDLAQHLGARGYAVDCLHGDLAQRQRDRVMAAFRERRFEFLVATDVAARGLDVDDLEVVFNFDMPNDAEDYTHRIGRTGRAGREGKAITFVSGHEIRRLETIVRFGKIKITRERVPSLEQLEERRTDAFVDRVRSLLESGEYSRHDRLVDRLLDQGHTATDIANVLIHLLQSGNPTAAPATGAPAGSAPSGSPAAPASRAPAPAAEGDDAPEPRGGRRVRVAQVEDLGEVDDEAPPRTGREPGYVTLWFNVGRKTPVAPGDLVGKIAGVTRLPSSVVGAIDLRQRHALVDVAADCADDVRERLTGIRLRGVVLEVREAR